MATRFARGAKARGKRIAFGNGQRILWGPWSEIVFRHNPNIAPPNDPFAPDLQWVPHYKGHRLYNSFDHQSRRWIWNYQFKSMPGEFFFSPEEAKWAESLVTHEGVIVIEPNTPPKNVQPNKQWSKARYEAVAAALKAKGFDVVQFVYPVSGVERIPSARAVVAADYRHAAAYLSLVDLYIGPEGGLHHASAAVGTPGVVIFGGFVPPAVTGYEGHINLTGGVSHWCGSTFPCGHCAAALDRITVDEVVAAAEEILKC